MRKSCGWVGEILVTAKRRKFPCSFGFDWDLDLAWGLSIITYPSRPKLAIIISNQFDTTEKCRTYDQSSAEA